MVIGITQEQHPERCRLYAQWQEIDWPILWDPFNLTGSKVVPNAIAIDEFGVVQMVGARSNGFMERFMEADYPEPSSTLRAGPNVCAFADAHGRDPGPVEWGMRGDFASGISALESALVQNPEDARTSFMAGVMRRMRYDSKQSQPMDFQLAVEHWTMALELDPNQYIWRRRIQQYGPRMDKPYPFYTWIERAREELLASGQTPVELPVGLTPAELAQPRTGQDEVARIVRKESDPDGRIERDVQGLIAMDSAVAFDTSGAKNVASVHLAFRPSKLLQAHWNHESGAALEVWLKAPSGVSLAQPLLEYQLATGAATSSEVVYLSGELTLSPQSTAQSLAGYALYYVCEGQAGSCRYLRQDFEIELRRP